MNYWASAQDLHLGRSRTVVCAVSEVHKSWIRPTRLFIHYETRWLDVPMNDPLQVGGIQSVGDLNTHIEYLFDLQWFAIEYLPECLSFQQFHRNECSPLDIVNFVDRADVWVIEHGRGFGLPLKADQCLVIFGDIVGQKLQSDEPIQ